MIMVGLIIFVVLYFNRRNKTKAGEFQRKSKTYTTLNFDISPESCLLYDSMVKSKVDDGRLTKFLQMEDNFLGYEKAIVYDGAGTYREAADLSALIKNTFSNWDLNYHDVHLKQMQNPGESLNSSIRQH